MTNKEHRLGVSETNLVVRHLNLEPDSLSDIAEAIAEIDEVYGLDSVTFEDNTHVLNLAYDATRTRIDGLEEILEKHGIEVSHDRWTNFKEGYYRFVDKNIKDNSTTEPWSCHGSVAQPPKRKK